MPILQVALDVPLEGIFDYYHPDANTQDVGRRVLVNFANRPQVGVVMGVAEESAVPSDRLKDALELWRDVPPLPQKLLDLLKFASAYYHHPLGQVINNALPPALRRVAGWQPPKRTPKTKTPPSHPVHPLNPEQNAALNNLMAHGQKFGVHLLFGITGSGKTEVYLSAMEPLVKAGGQVLVLVPEINLTPALEQRFQSWFPDQVLVSLHSGVSEKERARRYLAAANGEASIVLGTRLSVFTPLPKLSMVVVDEEHDASYKQQEGLRYSARDLAIVRGQMENIPVVLASATPSLESWNNATQARYQLQTLTSRGSASAQLPQVLTIPAPREGERPITWEALQALQQNLEQGQQSLVFINRRGFAPVLYCDQCRWVMACEQCSSRMVFHQKGGRMRCHHCGDSRLPPQACPQCGNTHLSTLGMGTQRVETFLAEYFPEARIMRLDSDTVSSRSAFEEAAQAIRERTVDIILGTQMISKGHDFPGITLVVVLDADQSLYSNDLRAQERLFAQLVQVAGRAGRGDKAGKVLIQTSAADAPLFSHIAKHDYAAFAQEELAARKLTGFPPFVHQALLKATSENAAAAESFLREAAQLAQRINSSGITLFDPVPALMGRLSGKWRFHLLVQASERARLQSFLGHWHHEIFQLKARDVSWVMDVDPLEF